MGYLACLGFSGSFSSIVNDTKILLFYVTLIPKWGLSYIKAYGNFLVGSPAALSPYQPLFIDGT